MDALAATASEGSDGIQGQQWTQNHDMSPAIMIPITSLYLGG